MSACMLIMEIWKIVLIAAAALAFVLLILIFTAVFAYNTAFNRRYDKNKLLKYFTAEDFNLIKSEISLGCLNGAVYSKAGVQNNGKIIIFVHGMGPGHCAYITEIAYFCNLGYTVAAVDSLGCGDSFGKKIKGMYEGVISAVDTIDFVQKHFPQNKIYLVGHSWGGYSALCAASQRKIDKVIAISAPSTPAKTLMQGAKPFIGGLLASILKPFWWLANLCIFGIKGNSNAAKCATELNIPVLLVHGDCDKIVNPGNAVINKASGKHISKLIAKGKAHNPYNTLEAEAKLCELSSALARVRKMTEDEKTAYFSNFDFNAATLEDEEIMLKISEFLSE